MNISTALDNYMELVLNPLVNGKTLGNETDLNTFVTPGIYAQNNGNAPAHSPSGWYNAIIIIMVGRGGDDYYQFYICHNENKIAFRTGQEGYGWSSWYRINTTAI